ncbi:MAG: I78 family peptidase inhibitor [Pseudomonadota bacterium]
MRWMLLTLVFLSACQTVEAEDPITDVTPEADTTDSDEVISEEEKSEGLIERTPDSCGIAENEELVGQPIESFDQENWPAPVRVIPPGSIITNDYIANRINFDVDRQGTVTRIWCG